MDEQRAAQLLNVPVDASPDRLKAEYRRRLFDVHPDRGGSDGDTRELISAVAFLLKRHPVLPVDVSVESIDEPVNETIDKSICEPAEARPPVWRVVAAIAVR